MLFIKTLRRKNTGQDVFERTLGRSDGDGQRKFSAENFCGESENILSSILVVL